MNILISISKIEISYNIIKIYITNTVSTEKNVKGITKAFKQQNPQSVNVPLVRTIESKGLLKDWERWFSFYNSFPIDGSYENADF